jgi:hypothetical protein
MKNTRNQLGVAALEVVLLLLLVGIVGFTGYKVLESKQDIENSSQSAADTSGNQPAKTSTSVGSVNELNNDLKELDQTNPDDNGADLNQLDKELSAF